MRILLVEDTKKLAAAVKKGLEEKGFAVDHAADGEEGLYLAGTESYNVIILDVMLPKKSGIDVCRELRSGKITTPILMLTAKSRLEDKIEGLDSGADDYLVKPFAFAELLSRIHALIRRSFRQPQSVIRVDNLEIDPLKRRVKRAGQNINLTSKEFSLLEFLARHRGEVVTRTQIMEHTWDYNFESMSNIVDVFIAGLRRKIDSGGGKKLIITVRGAGYRLGDD